MLMHRGEAAKAQTFFTHALTHYPLALITHINLGQALFEQGEIASAIAQYRAAPAVDPRFFAAHQGLALLYEATGDAVRSEHHWERAFENGRRTTSCSTASATPLAARCRSSACGRCSLQGAARAHADAARNVAGTRDQRAGSRAGDGARRDRATLRRHRGSRGPAHRARSAYGDGAKSG
jgi:tetratricopeptide (TPR) repeat protein